jgi:hypothetical protein
MRTTAPKTRRVSTDATYKNPKFHPTPALLFIHLGYLYNNKHASFSSASEAPRVATASGSCGFGSIRHRNIGFVRRKELQSRRRTRSVVKVKGLVGHTGRTARSKIF